MASNCYNIPAENGSPANEGMTVEYYFYGENGEPLESQFCMGAEHAGSRRSKVSLKPEFAGKLQYVPGIYNGEFEMKIGSDGKPVLNLVDFKFISGVKFASFEPDRSKASK